MAYTEAHTAMHWKLAGSFARRHAWIQRFRSAEGDMDPAGEWSRGSPDFMQKMIDNGIDVRQLPTNVDKRGLGKGEMAVQITKTHMQAIMLSTRLEEDMWREAIEYTWHVHNLLCLTRKASPRGNGPRPLQEISRNNIDAEECDRRKDYSIPPGSLALVHLPGKHGGAYNLTNSKYGRAVRMDVAVQ